MADRDYALDSADVLDPDVMPTGEPDDECFCSGGSRTGVCDQCEGGGYPKTPVDCLISELRDEFHLGSLTQARFEERVAQFKAELGGGGLGVAEIQFVAREALKEAGDASPEDAQ